MKRLNVLVLAVLLNAFLKAQDLPRRVYLGIRMENLTADMKRIMELENANGVLVSEVFNSSTAGKAGIKRGDILLSVNDKAVNSGQEVLSALSGYAPGETFKFELSRNKKKVKGSALFQSYPLEMYAGLKVIYTQAKSEIGLHRIILTKPETEKKLPLLVFIGGIGCYSLDSPLDTNRSEIRFLNDLSRAGFICARLEKPGMGDNAGHCKSCAEVSFSEETSAYVEDIKALKLRKDVDSGKVYIFGHSMGGVFAPLIAKKTPVKAVLAYGTIGSSFIEYLAKTRRTIAEAYAMPPDEADEMIKDFCECGVYYFADKLTTEQAAAKKPVCKEYLPIFDLRSRKYNEELYSYNIPQLWKSFEGKALLIWGESDYISSKEDHQIIHHALNYFHPGSAEFKTIPQADHGMNTAKNFAQARQNPGKYNSDISKAVVEWLESLN